jgi:hypothetical protein
MNSIFNKPLAEGGDTSYNATVGWLTALTLSGSFNAWEQW